MRFNDILSSFYNIFVRITRNLPVLFSVVPLCIFSICAMAADNPGKPQYGTWGFDAAGADPATKPGDNFFRYANGTWLDNTQIPSDKPAYSLRLAMTDKTEQRVR